MFSDGEFARQRIRSVECFVISEIPEIDGIFSDFSGGKIRTTEEFRVASESISREFPILGKRSLK